MHTENDLSCDSMPGIRTSRPWHPQHIVTAMGSMSKKDIRQRKGTGADEASRRSLFSRLAMHGAGSDPAYDERS